jgi:hypothetical protein
MFGVTVGHQALGAQISDSTVFGPASGSTAKLHGQKGDVPATPDRICGGQLSRQRRRADLVAATGGRHLALEIFLIFYVTCIAMTWWFYLRKSFMAKQAPSLAETRV